MDIDINKRLATKDIAEMLGIEAVTVRKYAQALEKAGYIFERSDSDHRVFSGKDAMALQQLKAIRERSGLNVEMAANIVASKHQGATEIVSVPQNPENSAELERYENRYAALEEKIDALAQIIAQQQQAAIASIQEPRQQRMELFTMGQAERRVKRRLEAEALELWLCKPEAERLHKIGWFRKEENVTARDVFVRQYVDERIDALLREELGLADEDSIEGVVSHEP